MKKTYKVWKWISGEFTERTYRVCESYAEAKKVQTHFYTLGYETMIEEVIK